MLALIKVLYKKIIKRLFPEEKKYPQKGEERNSDYYDRMFIQHGHWKKHYTASHHYPVWTVVADRISRTGAKAILDIGCGPGQFAMLLHDKGLRKYLGIDFSPEMIKQAKAACPNFDFIVADVYKTDIFDVYDYDTVVSLEFLEHVEKDLEVIDRIRRGTRFFATVPNFLCAQHVRCFKDYREVLERYGGKFKDLSVDTHLANDSGAKYFILEGVKTD